MHAEVRDRRKQGEVPGRIADRGIAQAACKCKAEHLAKQPGVAHGLNGLSLGEALGRVVVNWGSGFELRRRRHRGRSAVPELLQHRALGYGRCPGS